VIWLTRPGTSTLAYLSGLEACIGSAQQGLPENTLRKSNGQLYVYISARLPHLLRWALCLPSIQPSFHSPFPSSALVLLTVVVLVYTATLLDELRVDVCFDVANVVCWGVDVAVTVVVFTAGAGGPDLSFPSSGGGFGLSDFAGAGLSTVVVVVVAAAGGGGSLLGGGGAFEGLASSSETVDVIVVTAG